MLVSHPIWSPQVDSLLMFFQGPPESPVDLDGTSQAMISCTGILYRVFLSWCPFPSRVVTQFDSLSLSFADPWWKVIHDFIAYIYTPMVWTYRPLNFHEVWSADCHGMWSGFRTAGPLFGRKIMARSSAAVRIVPPCAASNNACRRQQWCWKRSPSEHHHILQHCHWKELGWRKFRSGGV